MSKSSARFALSAALPALLLGACKQESSSAPEAPAAEIVLGSVGSLTGPGAAFGTSARNGVDLAVEQGNARGGIGGRRVRVIHLDDQGRPEDAKAAAQRLVTKEKIRLLIGAIQSATTLAAGAVAERARIPMITPSSTLPKVTEAGEELFRVCFMDTFQAHVMARFTRNVLKLDRVAVLRGVDSEYSVGLSDAFIAEFQSLGGKVVADEAYVAEDPDEKGLIARVKKGDPQAIYIPSYYDDVRRLAPAVRAAGLDIPLLGGDGWDSDQLTEGGEASVEGSYFVSHFHPDTPRPEVAPFVEQYRNKYNEEPDAFAALGYDAAQVALEAIEHAGVDADSETLRKTLSATSGHRGVTGMISFDAVGNATKPAVVLRIEEGKRRFVAAIDPR